MTKSEKLAQMLIQHAPWSSNPSDSMHEAAAHMRALQKVVEEAEHYITCKSHICKTCDGLDAWQQMEQHAINSDHENYPCNCFKAEFMRDAD